jgi:hypothetical protein
MRAATKRRGIISLSLVRRGVACAGVLACLAVLGAPAPGFAQDATDQNNGAAPQGRGGGGGGGGGRHRGSGGQGGGQTAKPVLAPIPEARDPWPRLDSGALICSSKSALEQHQAAASAHVSGGAMIDRSGCQFIQHMTAVTLVAHDGLARTEVSLPTASGPNLVWTDVFIPAQPPPAH